MKLGEFTVPYIVTESANTRNRGHWGKQFKKDQKLRRDASIMFSCHVPRSLLVSAPHPRRKISLVAHRLHELDWDNLVSGLKPFVDVLRCRRKSGVVLWEGVVWDDSPEFLDLEVEQQIVEDARGVGIQVVVSTIEAVKI